MDIFNYIMGAISYCFIGMGVATFCYILINRSFKLNYYAFIGSVGHSICALMSWVLFLFSILSILLREFDFVLISSITLTIPLICFLLIIAFSIIQDILYELDFIKNKN